MQMLTLRENNTFAHGRRKAVGLPEREMMGVINDK
jgi:hypothetical protein